MACSCAVAVPEELVFKLGQLFASPAPKFGSKTGKKRARAPLGLCIVIPNAVTDDSDVDGSIKRGGLAGAMCTSRSFDGRAGGNSSSSSSIAGKAHVADEEEYERPTKRVAFKANPEPECDGEAAAAAVERLGAP